MQREKKHIFIIGSKGIPAKYGGFETFVDKLTELESSKELQYYVACMGEEYREYTYHHAVCFQLKIPDIGPARAVYYDLKAMNWCLAQIKKRKLKHCAVYVLACRIGPFMGYYKRRMKAYGVTLFVNPDGHEWKRSKWNSLIKRYWKYSERLMVKHADMVICDSRNIEAYIQKSYAKYQPVTTYIAYGSDTRPSSLADDAKELAEWYREKKVKSKEYFLAVGRLVPENNYETMIREFMRSDTSMDFVLITNENEKLLKQIQNKTGFYGDQRIKFVGTVYNQELLKKIRENAFGYFHGHEVGGTNPSLLEALAGTDVNMLLDVGFNREVAGEAALYWTKEEGSLAGLIKEAGSLSKEESEELGRKARMRIEEAFRWTMIEEEYQKVFSGIK